MDNHIQTKNHTHNMFRLILVLFLSLIPFLFWAGEHIESSYKNPWTIKINTFRLKSSDDFI